MVWLLVNIVFQVLWHLLDLAIACCLRFSLDLATMKSPQHKCKRKKKKRKRKISEMGNIYIKLRSTEHCENVWLMMAMLACLQTKFEIKLISPRLVSDPH
ncbi:unnamed protein product [Victoria cruziana]